MKTIKFEKVNKRVAMTTAYGELYHKKNVTMSYEIIFPSELEEGYGSFEVYDLESGGDDFYAEGGMWFEGKRLFDYDGVFSLPTEITDALKKEGFDVSEVV